MAAYTGRRQALSGTASSGSATGQAAMLWARARALRERSERAGAVIPLAHRTETFTSDGLTWVLRILTGAAPHAPTNPDPFLPPYDPRLHVAELGPRHVLLLNKYPVLAGHLLIVTREWAPQAAFPRAEDFAAAARLLGDGPSLAFYNGGPESGASQPHRHFQAVTLPLGPAAEAIPTRRWIERAAGGAPLPFAGAAAGIAPGVWQEAEPGECLREIGGRLLARAGRDPRSAGSFNLLFTRKWMLAVPRRTRRYHGVSINSLGYAGALIAKSGAGLRALRNLGPLAILAGAAGDNTA